MFRLAAILLLLPALAFAESAGPVRVIDGDTIEVAGRTLDLYGIDAPEPGQRCRLKGKPFDCGHIAKTALMDLTAAARAVCEPRGDSADGAVVARCRVDGFDLSRNMVHTGWALADRAVTAVYAGTEGKARAAKRGLWRTEFVTPWDWRRGARLGEPGPQGSRPTGNGPN
jgi:endonuclease YncB( thermonuclease family)